MITEQQRQQCITLYKQGECSIKEIMKQTDIGSSQSVYRILSKAGVTLQRPNETHRASITFDEDAWRIIERKQPRNLSKFVCKAIKKTYGMKKE